MNKVLLILTIILTISAITNRFAQASDLRITVQSEQYTIEQTEAGHKITVANSGFLHVPGKPYLPAQKLMIALPPGTRAISADIIGKEPTHLKGVFQIIPSPHILPLADSAERDTILNELNREWQDNNAAVYGSNQAYPAERGKLTGAGTLRKYSYAAVSFYPFSYNPAAGALIHYNSADIIVHYAEPSTNTAEAQRMEELFNDTVADKKAASLFVNYSEIKNLYKPHTSRISTPGTYDYVIITSSNLVDTILNSNFPAWKAAQGHSIRIILTSVAEAENKEGFDTPQAIRYYLRDNYAEWSIRYVLIVGDIETVPMRYCYPNPNNHTHNPTDPQNPGGSVPTDYYYADLSYLDEDSWDLDGDTFYGEYTQDMPDFLAEVSVARIPISDTTKVAYALNKMVSFEQDTGAWKQHALHGGAILFYANENHNGYPVVDGVLYLHAIEKYLMPGWTIQHYSEAEGLAPSVYPWLPISQTAFSSAWRNGEYAVVNWGGHGSSINAHRPVWQWDDGDGVPETDGSDGFYSPPFIGTGSSLDDDHPSIVFALSCNIGFPEVNYLGRMGVDLLTKPGFGSGAGVLSSSRGAAVDAYWQESHAGAMCIGYEFNVRMISNASELGNAVYDTKHYCHQNFGWDHYYEFQNMYDYNFYGDPTMLLAGFSTTPPPVPNGSGATIPLTATKLSGSQLEISWDSTSCPATEYNLIYGDITDVSTYAIAGSKCAVLSNGGNPNTWDNIPAGSFYFLMVGTNGVAIESSWGMDSLGNERNGADSSAQCTINSKDTSATCP